MAYKVSVICDQCGAGYSWMNYTVTMPQATRIVRSEGWSVGKRRWICPKCKKERKGATSRASRKDRLQVEKPVEQSGSE